MAREVFVIERRSKNKPTAKWRVWTTSYFPANKLFSVNRLHELASLGSNSDVDLRIVKYVPESTDKES